MMHKLFLSVITSISLAACANGSKGLSESEKQLQWLKTANAQEDAQAAVRKGDFRLMGMAQRNLVIPGIDVKKSAKYELRCGVNIMPGVTDVIHSESHLQMLKQAHTYALQYNAVIKTHCQP